MSPSPEVAAPGSPLELLLGTQVLGLGDTAAFLQPGP